MAADGFEILAGSPCLNTPIRTKAQVAEQLGHGLAPVDLIRDMTALHDRLSKYLHLRRDIHDDDEWMRMAGFADKLSDAISELRVTT